MVYYSLTEKLMRIFSKSNNDNCAFSSDKEQQLKENGTTVKDLVQKKSRIDEEQTESAEEHFRLIMADNTLINSEHSSVTPDDLPDWLDEELFKTGQKYYTKNVLGMSGAYLAGLFAVLLVPSINKILVNTNKSSTPCTAFKRYIQTLLHVYNLHIQDYRDPKSKFYTSLNTIRWKHSMSSRCMLKRGDEGITQRDMVLTHYGFIAYVLLSAEMMALTNEPEEREGINHFWRVIGKLLGIPDRLNVCRKNEQETSELCRMIRDEVYVKHLRAPNSNFYLLSSASISGLQCVDVMLDMDAFLAYFHEINGCEFTRKISLYSRYNYLYRKCMFAVIRMPVVGTVVRNFWNYYFFFMYWMQERYPVVAWIKYGKDQSKVTICPPLT